MSKVIPMIPQLFAHQKEGISRLVNSEYLMLGDEQGLGKTRQVIEAAQILHEQGKISGVVVITPQPVRLVWADPHIGELKKYCRPETQFGVASLSDKKGTFTWMTENESMFTEPEEKCLGWDRKLKWLIVNYERTLNENIFKTLDIFVSINKVALVLDESAYIKSHRAQRTRRAFKLRKKCAYCWLLNGTPVVDTPADIYTQGRIMSDDILECYNVATYRWRYARVVQTSYGTKYIWDQNKHDLVRRMEPHILRREKKQCLDLPEKQPSVPVFVKLGQDTWDLYKKTLKDIVIELGEDTELDPVRGGTRAVRLAQITSGFALLPDKSPYRISSEKVDETINQLKDSSDTHLIVWCRFRQEATYTADRISKEIGVKTYLLMGGQSPKDREAVLTAFSAQGTDERAVLVATVQCGKTGLNLTKATKAIYLSNTYSLFERKQSEDRIHRIGQHYDVSYADIIATGPDEQKTIDYVVMEAVSEKRHLEEWITSRWVDELRNLEKEAA